MRSNKQILRFAISVITIAITVMYMVGCGQRQLEIEKLKASYIRALDEFFAADFVRHSPRVPDIEGLDAYKQHIVDGRSVYSNFQLTINSMIMEGNTSAARFTFQATHSPTGKQISNVTGCNMYQWKNGKVVEYWHYADSLGMLQQLGYTLVPPEEQGEK